MPVPLKASSDYIHEITNLVKSNQLEEARRQVIEALKVHLADKDLLLTANSLFRSSQDYHASVAYAKQLIQSYPSFPEGYCRAAQDLGFHLSLYKEALDIISIACQRFPDDLWILWTAFSLHQVSGDDELALVVGEKLVDLHPTFADVYPPYVKLLLKCQQDLKANQVIEAAFSILPTDIAIIRLRLDLLLRRHQYFEYRNWLYFLAMQMPEHLHEFLVCIHRLDVMSSQYPSPQRDSYACDVCCIASDESPYIAEFIHHYLFLGFSNIYIGLNNCVDSTEVIIRKISSVYPNVHILDVNEVQSQFMQTGCYRVLFDYARRRSTSAYCLFVDVDEFWVADPFPRSIRDFLVKRPAFDVYCLHWILLSGEDLFSPPLTPPKEYVWDQHLKSICSYDTSFIDIRCHAPQIALSDQVRVMKGLARNNDITASATGIDVHQSSEDYDASAIGTPGLAWILHRMNRSELEYSYRLFRRRATVLDNKYLKTNRDGYGLIPGTPGAKEYFDQLMSKTDVMKYHDSLNQFNQTCDLIADIKLARAVICEEEVFNRLKALSPDVLASESEMLRKMFAGTRFLDWVVHHAATTR
jgi:tetratricopeptide (TPR) repeat protein